MGAGLTGSVAGVASLISYPALLASGLSPVSANMTNTVSLVFSSLGSASGSRPELRGQRARVTQLGIVAVLGGILGGVLLLATPPGSFERIVPWLVGFGSLSILVTRRSEPDSREAHAPASGLVLLGVFAIGIYAGYFGAAAGILLLALLLRATPETVPRCNAVKNVVTGLANLVAAIVFAVFGSVDWAVAVPLAFGLFVGGRVGPVIVRHSRPEALRTVIALAGVVIAVHLGLNAYR